MLKKLSLIILITVLASSQFGYYLLLLNQQSVRKEQVKQKILAQLKDEELEVISPSNEIYWEEEGKEFFLNGEMYDVIKIKKVKGKVMLYCINDKKEKSLIDKYNKITDHNSSSDNKAKLTIDNSINLFIYQNEVATTDFSLLISNNFSPFNLSLPCNISNKISPAQIFPLKREL